jgi:polyphenol oxidase
MHHPADIPTWPSDWIAPDLSDGRGAPLTGVVACMSARAGGVSQPPWDSFNLGDHVGDDAAAVAHNRARAGRFLAGLAGHRGDHAGWPVGWLKQVHGAQVHRLKASDVAPGQAWVPPVADGVFTTEPGLVCAVMVADCLPILLADREGRGVAALHAGWRGLSGAAEMGGLGIVEAGVSALCEASQADPADLVAWLGPCIGPRRFQVGSDVLQAFGVDPHDLRGAMGSCFRPDVGVSAGAGASPASPRWWADLAGLARGRLVAAGVGIVRGGDWCTVEDSARFFSYRRDGLTGRQAAMVALR